MRKEFTYLARLSASICAALLISACAERCGSVSGEAAAEDFSAGGERGSVGGLSGSLRLAGSTSMDQLSGAWAEGFMEKYPDVTVTAEYVGSSAGIEAVLSGEADIGNSSRDLKEEEKAAGAVENLVAADGIVVCTDRSNRISGLTCRQLADIYTGIVRNWSELGGADLPVVVVGREAGSGTRGTFEKILGVEDQCSYANELDSTGAVMARVAATPGAIGYLSMDAADESLAILSLEGVEPCAENIRDGSYALSRPFVMVTKGEMVKQDELVQRWFDYIYSDEGQEIAARMGFVTVR